MVMGLSWTTHRLERIPFNHFNSHVGVSTDLYSASAEDREIVCCCFVFQEIGESPSCTSHPVTDRLVKGQLAQSKSQHPYSCKSHSRAKNMSCLGLPFKNQTMWSVASQCSVRGSCMN